MALLDSELARIRYELGVNLMTLGAEPFIGVMVLFSQVIQPYLSTGADHQGLILHSVYHRPNGWNWQPGESSMWGDYHARELGLYLLRQAEGLPYLAQARQATLVVSVIGFFLKVGGATAPF